MEKYSIEKVRPKIKKRLYPQATQLTLKRYIGHSTIYQERGVCFKTITKGRQPLFHLQSFSTARDGNVMVQESHVTKLAANKYSTSLLIFPCEKNTVWLKSRCNMALHRWQKFRKLRHTWYVRPHKSPLIFLCASRPPQFNLEKDHAYNTLSRNKTLHILLPRTLRHPTIQNPMNEHSFHPRGGGAWEVEIDTRGQTWGEFGRKEFHSNLCGFAGRTLERASVKK